MGNVITFLTPRGMVADVVGFVKKEYNKERTDWTVGGGAVFLLG